MISCTLKPPHPCVSGLSPEGCEKASRDAALTLEEYLWGTPHRQVIKHTAYQTPVSKNKICQLREWMCVWNVFCSFVVLYVAVGTDCAFCFVFLSVFFPPPVFPISLPASSLTLTVFLCCYLSTAHQASPAGYAAEPLPHRTKQPGIHWYAVRCDPLPPPSQCFCSPPKYLTTRNNIIVLFELLIMHHFRNVPLLFSGPLLRSLHWLPVAARIRFKTLVLAYRAVNWSGPVYIQDMVKPYTPARSLRSASANQLVAPSLRAKHSTKSRLFAVLAPKWWNELPNDIRKSIHLPPQTKNTSLPAIPWIKKQQL